MRATAAGIVLAFALLGACAPRDGGPAPIQTGAASSAQRPAAPAPRPQVATPAAGTVTVQAGDTLYAVARRSNVPMRALIDANGLRPPYAVFAGQKLRLPPAAVPPAALPPAAGPEVGPPPAAPAGASTGQASAPPPSEPPRQIVAGGAPPAAPAVPVAVSPPADSPALQGRAGRFVWPLRGPIISAFGSKPGGLQNDGINIAAARGTPVRAAAPGVVVYAGNELKGFGNLLLVRHAEGWMSAYAHLDETLVERGAEVQRGQAIGRVGQTGNVSAPQLHFELRRAGRPVDPRGLLPAAQSADAN